MKDYGSCVKSRYGCRGRVVREVGKYRDASGRLSEREVLVCNRCGQAHGVPR